MTEKNIAGKTAMNTAETMKTNEAWNAKEKAVRRRAYVVRKMIPVLKEMRRDAETLAIAKFRQELTVAAEHNDGWLEVYYVEPKAKDPAEENSAVGKPDADSDSAGDAPEEGVTWSGKKKKKNQTAYTVRTGFIRKAWTSEKPVHDLARLPYRNLTGKRYPTSLIYGGKKTGLYIEPGETVYVLAYCSPYALTSKGWARTDLVYRPENSTENCLVYVPPENTDGILNMLKGLNDLTVADYVTDERLRKSIRNWAGGVWFRTVFGDYTQEFVRRCEKALADDLEAKEEKRRKDDAARRRKALAEALRRWKKHGRCRDHGGTWRKRRAKCRTHGRKKIFKRGDAIGSRETAGQ